MAFEKLSDRVRQLIGENDQRAAADLLLQALRDKNSSLFNIALVQQANIKKLADQSAAGILSADETNREQARTNVALLHLSDEYARLYEGADVDRAFPRWALWAAAGLVALVLIGWLVKNAGSQVSYPATFDLTVRLHEPGGEQMAIREGQVNLRLGEAVPQEPHALTADGEAVFRDLSEKYRDKTVQLLYSPAKDRRFKIREQSAAAVSGQNQTILFTLEFLPDTTIYEATLRDSKGRTVPAAQITVDGNLHAVSDEHGYFKIAIPKASGEQAHFVVEKKGARLFEQDLTISSGHNPFPLE
ncbi:MAG: hypothetical protein ABIQ93_04360 [Saprospiraceae bacterium]